MKKLIVFMTAAIMCIGMIAVYADTSIENGEKTTDAENITVTSEGKVLEKGVDYTLEYKDNVNPGTATVTVNFIGNYAGEMEQTFQIVKKKHTSSGGGGHSGWVSTVGDEDTAVDNAVTEYTPPYITGYGDNTFRPNAPISRAETAAVVMRVIGADTKAQELQTVPKFSDISEHWACEYINTAADKGIVKGYGDDTYRPDSDITRAEFAKIIVKMLGDTEQNNEIAFSDIAGHWAEPYILTLVGKGIITGYPDGTFHPDEPITRAETIAIINRAVKRNISPLAARQFTDVTPAHWAYEEIMKAVQ